MEVTKRTYQKHNTEKKITVKHDLIPKLVVSQHKYRGILIKVNEEFEISHFISSIYVQVTYNRKSTKFRCKIKECYLDSIPKIPIFENFREFENYYLNEKNDLVRGLVRDSNYIKWIVEQEIRMNPKFDISELPEIYNSQRYDLVSFVEYCLNHYLAEKIDNKISYAIENGADSSKYKYNIVNLNIPAIQNLEHFINLYPELELSNIKKEYYPQFWSLNYYLEESTITYRFDMEIQGNEKYRYYVDLPTSVTVFDYLTNIAKRVFLPNSFATTETIESIFMDLDKLFAEKFNDYDFRRFYDKDRFLRLIFKQSEYNDYMMTYGYSNSDGNKA